MELETHETHEYLDPRIVVWILETPSESLLRIAPWGVSAHGSHNCGDESTGVHQGQAGLGLAGVRFSLWMAGVI